MYKRTDSINRSRRHWQQERHSAPKAQRKAHTDTRTAEQKAAFNRWLGRQPLTDADRATLTPYLAQMGISVNW